MSDRRTVVLDRGREEDDLQEKVVETENSVPEVMRHEWEERVAPVWRRLPLMADWIEHYGV